jgi:ribose transport system substrate-binding protein
MGAPRVAGVAIALAALAVVAGACGGYLAGDVDDSDKVRVGFVPKSLNQEYWVNTKKGAEAAAGGNVEVITQAAGSDLEIQEQIDIVENLLVQDIDALAIAPSSSDLLLPVLEKAAKDVPVVLFDSDIPDWKEKVSYVGTENFEGAKLAGKYIAKQLKDGGELAVIAGIPGSEIGIERVDGMKKGLKEAKSEVEVVKEVPGNFDREQAVGAMEDILQTNPDIDAVFCANDQMALGAVESISARDKQEQILLVGFDGALEATQKILAGDMDATVSQDPYAMGKRGVETAVAKLRGDQVKRKINTGAALIEGANAERYFERVRERLGGTGRGLEG